MTPMALLAVNYEAVQNAIEQISTGKFKKVEVDGIKIYRVKNIIRIDMEVSE